VDQLDGERLRAFGSDAEALVQQRREVGGRDGLEVGHGGDGTHGVRPLLRRCRHTPLSRRAGAADNLGTSARDVTPSLAKMRIRWPSTVFSDRKISPPISRFVRPSANSRRSHAHGRTARRASRRRAAAGARSHARRAAAADEPPRRDKALTPFRTPGPATCRAVHVVEALVPAVAYVKAPSEAVRAAVRIVEAGRSVSALEGSD
jgi:hypothetical protein